MNMESLTPKSKNLDNNDHMTDGSFKFKEPVFNQTHGVEAGSGMMAV